MTLMIGTLNSSTASKELNDSEKMKPPTVAGESTIRLLKPSGLAGISTLDYVELRNYIYGVNGRY
jgi:hypothetical protein